MAIAMDRKTTWNAAHRIAAAFLALTLAVVVALPASAQRRVEAYKARHRTADELLPLATTAIGDRGEVALDPGTNTLVLMGNPAAVAEALELLSLQDRRLRTVVLRHTTRRARELTEAGLSIRWYATTGSFRLGNVAAQRPGSASRGHSGDTASNASADSSAELRAAQALRSLDESLTAEIRTTEGGRTRIETGTAVPYTVVGRSDPNTRFLDATTGFEASTRILGDGRVQVDLASFARELLPGGLIGKTTGSNVVVLKPGVVVAIAGLGSDGAQRRADAGAEITMAESGDETVLLIRADVE